MNRRTTTKRREGFTLLELMVALGIGGLTITTVYTIGMGATYEFGRQEQVSRTQTALRFALDLVKRDIERAGYLSTPNAIVPAGAPPQTCGGEAAVLTSVANGPLAAFSRFQDNIPISAANQNLTLNPDAANANDPTRFVGDSIVLMGNYETSSEYPGIRMVSATQVAVPQNWYSFQRDFTNWYGQSATNPTYQNTFGNNVFAVGRLVRIQTKRRVRHFARVVSVTNPATATDPLLITIDTPVPATCYGDADGGWIAPVSAIELRIMDRLGGTRYGGDIAQLMRREVQPDNKTALLDLNPGNRVYNSRSLLDFVVAFHLAFTMTDVTVPGSADVYTPGATTTDVNTVNGAPERIRSVTVDLAARTVLADRSIAWGTAPWTTAGCAVNYSCFKLGAAAGKGAARVRWQRAEVFVPNVAYEGY